MFGKRSVSLKGKILVMLKVLLRHPNNSINVYHCIDSLLELSFNKSYVQSFLVTQITPSVIRSVIYGNCFIRVDNKGGFEIKV